VITELFLVRHGQTDWNVQRRTQGYVDIALNQAGAQQAQNLVPVLSQHHAQRPFDVIISSDLSRAVATIEPSARQLGMPLHLDAGWRERNFGVLEGLTQSQMLAEQEQDYRGWLSGDPSFVIAQGESLAQLIARIGSRIDALMQTYLGQRILVMTHGGVVDAAGRCLGLYSVAGPRSYEIPNTCISLARYQAGQWQSVFWAQADHLAVN
jgi:2,3-bisphosphoglycerate-dependent phosphoglycerate mutase